MHRNAPLTPEGRLRLCHRIGGGWSVTAAAESMNISRQTASKWWGRYLREGIPGLADRSSRPWRSPQHTPALPNGRSFACAVIASWARRASAASSGSPHRRCTGS